MFLHLCSIFHFVCIERYSEAHLVCLCKRWFFRPLRPIKGQKKDAFCYMCRFSGVVAKHILFAYANAGFSGLQKSGKKMPFAIERKLVSTLDLNLQSYVL
jgi:hypothetical protein